MVGKTSDVHKVQAIGEETVKKAKVAGAETVGRLRMIVADFKSVEGSSQTFTAKQVTEQIRALDYFHNKKPVNLARETKEFRQAYTKIETCIKNGNDTFNILTKTYGIRGKARELILKGENRETLVDRAERRKLGWIGNAGVKMAVGRAERNEKRARKNRDNPQEMAKYISKAAETWERAAGMLEGTGKTGNLEELLGKALNDYKTAISGYTYNNDFREAADNIEAAYRIADRLGGGKREELDSTMVKRESIDNIFGPKLGVLMNYKEILNEAKRRRNASAAEAGEKDEEHIRERGY